MTKQKKREHKTSNILTKRSFETFSKETNNLSIQHENKRPRIEKNETNLEEFLKPEPLLY